MIDVNLDHWRQREKEREREIERQRARERERDREVERELTRQRMKEERERYIVQQAAQELAAVQAEPIDSDSDVDDHHSPPPPPEPDTSSESHGESVKVNVECIMSCGVAIILFCYSGHKFMPPMMIPDNHWRQIMKNQQPLQQVQVLN